MILDWGKVRIFVKPGPTDMRKQINGLSIIVFEELEMAPFGGNLFLSCNKPRRILKIIYLGRILSGREGNSGQNGCCRYF